MDNKQNSSGTNPNTHTDPLVQNISRQPSPTQPTVQLPNRPAPKSAVRFHSSDIGTKTAVQTDPFVKVEESFGDKVRRFFHLKPKQKDNANKKIAGKQPPSSASTPVKSVTPSQIASVASNLNQKQPSPAKTASIPNQKTTTDSTSNDNHTSKLKPLGNFLFAGKHKFISIPIIIIVIIETFLLILFLTGAISLKHTTDESIATTTNEEAVDIYDDVTNENSAQDTLDYWNSQFAKYEARSDYQEACNLRIKAADFYISREDKATALTILRNTKMSDSIGLSERFTLYSLIIALSNSQGYFDLAKAYQDAASRLTSASLFDGSATAEYKQLKALDIPANNNTDAEDSDAINESADMGADVDSDADLAEPEEPEEPVDDDPNYEESLEDEE